MKIKTSHKGFTIIELLVVIAIIALLSGVIITALTGSKSKSRDATRISDLNQMQLALEQYFDRCGQYPTVDSNSMPSKDTTCNVGGSQVTINSYISVIPHDPLNDNSHKYSYIVNGTNLTDYVLHATLENQNAAQNNSYPNSSLTASGNQWSTPGFNCYNPLNSSADYNYCISTH